LHASLGWLDESLHFGFDYEWFLRVLGATRRSVHVPALIGGLRYHADTKTSKHQAGFDAEYRRILAGRTLPRYQTRYYQARRLLLMLGEGRFRYVCRGMARRATG
jgi:hypothetical protein